MYRYRWTPAAELIQITVTVLGPVLNSIGNFYGGHSKASFDEMERGQWEFRPPEVQAHPAGQGSLAKALAEYP